MLDIKILKHFYKMLDRMKMSQRIFSEKCVEWDGSVGQPPMEWGGWSCTTTSHNSYSRDFVEQAKHIFTVGGVLKPVTNTLEFFSSKEYIPSALVEIKVTYEMSII